MAWHTRRLANSPVARHSGARSRHVIPTPAARHETVMTGEAFRQLRVSIHLLQTDVAELFGVSERTVQRWEASETVPGIAECAIEHLTTLSTKLPEAAD
jgi:DNA-binding transcriptional regulator YiaG